MRHLFVAVAACSALVAALAGAQPPAQLNPDTAAVVKGDNAGG